MLKITIICHSCFFYVSILEVRNFFFNPKLLIFFLFLHDNICCGNSLEAPCQGASNEYPQYMLSWRHKKNIMWIPLLIWSYDLGQCPWTKENIQCFTDHHLLCPSRSNQMLNVTQFCTYHIYPKYITFVEIEHEILSTVIRPLLLIRDGQLSVTGRRICTSTG